MSQRKIILSGFKGTGKDYIADNILSSSYKKYRIADNIKLSCIKHYLNLGIDILQEDSLILGGEKIDTNRLLNSQILELIDVYKSLPNTKTRSYLVNFMELQDKFGYDYWIKSSLKDLNSFNKTVNIVVTDCRFLIELLEFLLNDFFVINLYNSRLEDYKNSVDEYMFHSTENQLGILGRNGIGYNIDVSSRNTNYIHSVITETINLFYHNFTGYSVEFKKEIQTIYNELLPIIRNLENEIDKAYKEKDYITYSLYYKTITYYQNRIKKLVSKELGKYLIY